MAGALAFSVVAGYLILQSLASVESPRLFGENIPPARVLESLKALPEADQQILLMREQAVLRSNPLKLSALKNLAVLYELRGDRSRSQELTVLAGRRTLRDLLVQAAVLQILLDRKDYSGALYRLDGLIRARPESKTELLPLVASFAETPASLTPLVDMLSQTPPWRHELISLVGKSKQIDSVYRLLSELRTSVAPVTKQELRPFLERLIAERAFDKAYYVWLDFLSDVELRKVALVFDGNFDLELGNRFFDWTFAPIKNVDLRIVPRAPGSIDKVLRIDFASGRTAFNHFSQLLRLGAGNHIMSAEAKADDLKNDRGMVWRLYCLPDTSVLVESPPLLGTVAWENFESPFIVPAQNCATQLLRLELNARAELDYQVSGRVFYDNIAITKRDGVQISP